MCAVFYIHLALIFLSIQIIRSDVFVYNSANRLVDDFDDQPAKFGPPFPKEGLKGYITLTNPRNACTRVSPVPNLSIPGYNWIALIPRTKSNDSCDFDLKVFNAQAANFSAVIIYNYEDVLITMSPRGRSIEIPSTLITYQDGISIISNYLYNTSIANATTPPFFIYIDDEQFFRLGAYIIPMVAVVGTSFLGLIGFMIIKCFLNRRRNRRHRLPRSALKQLRTKKFVKGDRWDVCAICLDDYEEGAKLRILPCDHAYHMKCIDPWLLNNRRQCPVCKRYVFPNPDESEDDDQGRTATERTPLLRSNDEYSSTVLPTNRELERSAREQSGDHSSDISLLSEEPSDTDINQPLVPSHTRPNNITTNDELFDRSSSLSGNYSDQHYPRILLRQSSSQELADQSTVTYGSVQESSPTPFTTPRFANFFVGSPGATTDSTTNASVHSVIETTCDIDNDNNDERMYSVMTDPEVNQAFLSDGESV